MEISGAQQRPLKLNMNEQQKADAKFKVDSVNGQLKERGLKHKTRLGQDDFLKLLVTQLKHQDPLKPMQDKAFIAQMAQFSALEQITKVNTSIQSLSNKASEAGSYNLLGKKVTWFNQLSKKLSAGIVNSIDKQNDKLTLNVNGSFVGLSDIVRIENFKPTQYLNKSILQKAK